MFKLLASITTVLLATSPAAQASIVKCEMLDEQHAAALFERWNGSLQTGDASQVAALYTPHSVLLPTVSNTPRTDIQGKIEYFEHFLKKKPTGYINSSTLISGCNLAIDTGTYTFRFADDSKINARYTFGYTWVGNQWLITSHHSSEVPGS